jgi:TorA maturation chaperone TorD
MGMEEVEIRSLLHRVMLHYDENKHEGTDKIGNVTSYLSYLVDQSRSDGDREREQPQDVERIIFQFII